MIRIALPPEATSQLATTRRRRRAQVAERCRYVLLHAAGWSVPQMAQRFAPHAPTSRKWLKASHAQGLAGLDNAPPPGRPATKRPQLEPQADALLTQAPSVYG
jgi:transposase